MIRFLSTTLFLVLWSGNVTFVQAQRADEGPTYTDPHQTDEDFDIQGEYRGWMHTLRSPRSSTKIGLQVVALGDGQFDAVKFAGGLPGDGWIGHVRTPFHGVRIGETVRLDGADYGIDITEGVATLLRRDGTKAGELRKVERVSPTMGAIPPSDAIVLFDGTNTEHFVNAQITEDGLLLAGTDTVEAFQDFRLHGEFRIPYKPFARGQARGNSGFYLQSRYEVQVLDSFGLEGVENECGAVYTRRRPDVNMCFPPLAWQTYDIEFRAARFNAQGEKTSPMQISVWHNGVPVQNHVSIDGKTGAGKPEGPFPLPTKLQDHNNPVVYRNLWLVDRSVSQAAPIGALASLWEGPIPPVPIASLGGSFTSAQSTGWSLPAYLSGCSCGR